MNQQGRKKDSIWSFPFVVLMISSFFQSMAQFMANTTLPLYADSMGATASVVGIIVGSFTISALLVRPFAGPAFDSYSKRRLLLISQGVICIAMMLYGIADTIPFLIGSRLLHGLGIGCAAPLATAFASEFLPERKMASGISIFALAQTFAQVIGPAIGLWLVDAFGFSQAYLLAAGCLLAAMIGVTFVKEPERERLSYQLKLNRMFAPEALGKAVVLCLFAVPFSCMMAYVVLYGNLLGIQNIGIFFTVYALCLLGTRALFGKLADLWGVERMVLVSAACFAVSFVVLSRTSSFAHLMVVAVLGSAGFGACSPLLQSLALSSVSAERRGAASNTSFIALDVGMLLGPVIGGFAIEALEGALGSTVQAYSDVWLVMLVPMAIAAGVVVYWNVAASRGGAVSPPSAVAPTSAEDGKEADRIR